MLAFIMMIVLSIPQHDSIAQTSWQWYKTDLGVISQSANRANTGINSLQLSSTSSTGYEVQNVADSSWEEMTLNDSNAPAFDGVTSTSGPFNTGTWTIFDSTPLINGNGVFNIALIPTNSTAFSLASRESGANAPQLIIETLP